MVLTVVLTLALAAQQDEGVVLRALRYLARHQDENGSWGRRTRSCSCPATPVAAPPDEATRARIAALLLQLGEDDFERRLQSQKALVTLGPAAVGQLQAASTTGSLEVRWRSVAALGEIERATTEGDVELTSAALLAFGGAGFTHRSSDVYDDLHFGAVIEKGLQWLMDRQQPDGSFGAKTSAAQALAALALSEAFSMSARPAYKEPGQKAMDFIVAHPAADARGLFYQGMALKSAEMSELLFPKEAALRVCDALVARRGQEPWSIFILSGTQVQRIFWLRNKQMVDLSGIPGVAPPQMEMETAYVTTLALHVYDGRDGPRWKAWWEPFRDWIVPLQESGLRRCDRGSWPARGLRERMKSAALATLALG